MAALRCDDLQRWLPYLERVDLPLGKVLSEEGASTHYVHLPITAMVTKLHVMENGSSVEIAVVGCEGVVGLSRHAAGLASCTRTRGTTVRDAAQTSSAAA